MISVQFSFPNLYGLDEFVVGTHWVPGEGDEVRVYDRVFEVFKVEWVVSANMKYLGGVVVHLKNRGE